MSLKKVLTVLPILIAVGLVIFWVNYFKSTYFNDILLIDGDTLTMPLDTTQINDTLNIYTIEEE